MKAAVPIAAIAALSGFASHAMQGPLPGDVAGTAALQNLLGQAPDWAGWLTLTAKAPLLWGTLALAALLGWQVAGLRAALAVPLAYSLAFIADLALRAVVFVPRPDPALVAVADPATSSGLPSTFGLVYGAMFGAVLLAHGRGRAALAARLVAAGLLIAGLAARIVLGGHWASQMLASATLGLLLALAALAITARVAAISRA